MARLFITLEGMDGSGKTTCIENVKKMLEAKMENVIFTREPGGSEIAEQIRHVILDPKNTKMDVRTEALLYAASRRQHLIEKIIPNLEKNKVVICDRFVDSSLAYQGYARNIGIDEVYELNQFATEGLEPDLTIYFDLSFEEGLKRINSRTTRAKDRLDQEKSDFHRLVYEGYQEVIKRNKQRFVIVDANLSIEEVASITYEIIVSTIEKYDSK